MSYEQSIAKRKSQSRRTFADRVRSPQYEAVSKRLGISVSSWKVLRDSRQSEAIKEAIEAGDAEVEAACLGELFKIAFSGAGERERLEALMFVLERLWRKRFGRDT